MNFAEFLNSIMRDNGYVEISPLNSDIRYPGHVSDITHNSLEDPCLNICIPRIAASVNTYKQTHTDFHIKNVIFNDPATIVFWDDGSKTVVKVQNGEEFDPEKGIAMAITKKYFGNKGNYYNRIKKWVDKYDETDGGI